MRYSVVLQTRCTPREGTARKGVKRVCAQTIAELKNQLFFRWSVNGDDVLENRSVERATLSCPVLRSTAAEVHFHFLSRTERKKKKTFFFLKSPHIVLLFTAGIYVSQFSWSRYNRASDIGKNAIIFNVDTTARNRKKKKALLSFNCMHTHTYCIIIPHVGIYTRITL